MRKTKIETFIYKVLKRDGLIEIATITSKKELKTKKAQNDFLKENNYNPFECLIVLVDTETSLYYMEDDKFFELAEKMVEE